MRNRRSLPQIGIAIAALIAAVACGGPPSRDDGPPSLAEAREMAEELAESPPLAPPPGSTVTGTSLGVCGGDSAAVNIQVTRRFKGSLPDVQREYRERLERGGWDGFRQVPADGALEAQKDGQFIYVLKNGTGAWQVRLVHQSQGATCYDQPVQTPDATPSSMGRP